MTGHRTEGNLGDMSFCAVFGCIGLVLNCSINVDQVALVNLFCQNRVPELIPRYDPVPLSHLDNVVYVVFTKQLGKRKRAR